ncbi:PR/SET domain 13 [Anticarsia gemmatalis]|uniref:PR/SET domain 13 n=1 Tax=Anticarsia gemmatalis TaxID=129554 RepID=UPI003F76BFDD
MDVSAAPSSSARSRVLCRRGVARAALTAAFTAHDLLLALTLHDAEYVYVEPDSAGRMTTVATGGAARLATAARLAPHAPAATVELALAPAAPASHGAAPATPRTALVLRAAAALAPHDEALLWFADDALAALDMPHLTPRNVRARRDYVCHLCDADFADPNPLKLHLFLRCEPVAPQRFWREAARRLAAAPAAAPPPAPALRPAELEALATEWGRSRDGHRCLYCGKLYSRRYGLKIHLRTHTGYRPLRCRYCLRAFGDPSNLNKHVRLHAARGPLSPHGPAPLGPHSCSLCGRSLARRRDLERHLRAHAASSPCPPSLPAPGSE